jgi:hypothetical protein
MLEQKLEDIGWLMPQPTPIGFLTGPKISGRYKAIKLSSEAVCESK